MEKKFLFIVFSVMLISITPQVFAEYDLDALLERENGVLVEQQKIIFEVGKYSTVHIKHVIETGVWNEDRPRIIEILPGAHSNLTITDEDGDSYGVGFDGETFEKSKYIISKQKLGDYDLFVEYDLENFMELNNGLWKRDLLFPFDVMVMFDEEIEFIFANSRPVDVIDAKGINCVGCGLKLEYFDDGKMSVKEISSVEENFEIEFLSNEEIFEIEFIEGGTQLLNFDVKNEDQLFILKIPFGNFLNPYNVYFTEEDDTSLDQLDKIRKSEFSQNETHVNLSFRTFGEGTISIVGATPEEHQKKLEQIENIKAREVKTGAIEEREKGLALPIPGTKAALELAAKSGQIDEEKIDELSFADELEKGPVQNLEDNTIIVAIVTGIIIAGIIGIVIFKLKKN